MNFKKILFYLLCVLLFVCILNFFFFKSKVEEFSNINSFNSFDAFLFINLKNRIDRKKQILKELEKIKIPKNKIIRINAVYDKTNGHIGCAKSHIKALEYAKNNNLENVVIFEDDFVFTKSKEEIDILIKKFFNFFKNDWDVLQLTASHNDVKNININEFKKVKSAMAPSGYIINNKFYDILIKKLTDSVTEMEKEMKDYDYNKHGKKLETSNAFDQYWIPLQKKSNWYIFSDFIGKQGGEAAKSSIMNKTIEQLKNKNSNFKETFHSKLLIYV